MSGDLNFDIECAEPVYVSYGIDLGPLLGAVLVVIVILIIYQLLI